MGAPRKGAGAGGTLPPQPAPPAQVGLRECDYSAFMSVLDTHKDCEVDFVEYVRSLACLCTFCHDYFKDGAPVTPCSQ